MKLFDYQKADIRKILREPTKGVINASATGAGKTYVGVEVMRRSGARRVLIVAPLNTYTSWRDAIKLRTGLELRDIGNNRNAAVAATRDLDAGKPGWYFVGWEWAATRSKYSEWRLSGVIFDEAHRGAGRNTRSAKMAYEVGNIVWATGGYRLALSATPWGNKYEGAWAVARAIWPFMLREYNSFWRWATRHLKIENVNIAKQGEPEKLVKKITKELEPGSIVKEFPLYIRHEATSRCCKYHPKGVQGHLPPRVVKRVGVTLSPAQRKIYDQMERYTFAWIEDHEWPIESKGLPVIQACRLHQICMAVPTTELSERLSKPDKETGERVIEDYIKVSYPLTAKSSKLDAMMDILMDIPTDQRVIVYTHSRGIIEAALHRINRVFASKDGTPAAAGWHGGNRGSREQIKAQFIAGERRIIVAQIHSIGEGTDGLQQVCSNEVWLSMAESSFHNIQALGRLFRQGQKRWINSWQIYAEDTVELEQYERLMKHDADMAESLKMKHNKKKKVKK